MVGCYNNASGWTGVPLISTASRRPRKFSSVNQNVPVNHFQASKTDFDENAMSRLALHAHGAPLILANNRQYRSNKSGVSKPNKVSPNHVHHTKIVQNSAAAQFTMAAHPNDALSVASDESGPPNSSPISSSSDTCLPRIIKPRKRRKKDRKPNVQNVTTVTSAAGTPTASIDSIQTNQQLPTSPLLLDEPTRDILQEIALMANAGGSFDYNAFPLIREQQLSQAYQHHQQQQQQQQQQLPQSQHFSSSNSDSSDSGINSLACSCRLCDPFGKIWAFPLRRSCSDNSAEIELNRAKDVGVIGSNRSNSFRSEWRSSMHSLDHHNQQQKQQQQQQQQSQINGQQQVNPDFGSGSSRKGSFSDSGDSGCDLLSGLTFCSEDILSSVNRDLFLTPVDSTKEFKFPTTGGGGGSANSISDSGSPGSVNSNASDSSESMLISELTKKLNEGLDLGRGRSSSSGGCSDSGSVFSDGVFGGGNNSGCASGGSEGSPQGSGIGSADLFVNFDAISRNNLFSVNNISKLSNLLFDDGLTAPGLVINSGHSGSNNTNNNVLGGGNGNSGGVNYIRSKNIQNLQPSPPSSSSSASSSSSSVASPCGTSYPNPSSLFSDHQPFIFVPDADRGCEVLSCFDMVWSNDRKLLPVEE